MLESGKFVAQHLEPHNGGELRDKQVQPNGVDLTIDEVYLVDGAAAIGDEEYNKPNRYKAERVATSEISKKHQEVVSSDWVYDLGASTYVVVYNEEIEIPEGFTGFVLPRSRLLRSGADLTTAVWDSGYNGRGEGGLVVSTNMYLDPGARIGQMVMFRSETTNTYDGTHQGERVDK